MPIISGLFTFPYNKARLAYEQVYYKIPLQTLSGEAMDNGSFEYLQCLANLSNRQIKADMDPLLNKSGIRKDIRFIDAPNAGFCCARGTNTFQQGDAVVYLAPGFYGVDKDACSWLIKHEISHIKNDDAFAIYAVAGISQLAASIFGMSSLSFPSALAMSFMVGSVAQALFSQWREAKADDFATKNSSDEELKGGRRFLISMQISNLEQRKTPLEHMLFSEEGENRTDIFHPSIASRIEKIEKALLARGVFLDKAAETKKIETLKPFVAYKIDKIKKELEKQGGPTNLLKELF